MFHRLYRRGGRATLAFLILLFPAIIGFGLLTSNIVPQEKVSKAQAYARVDAPLIEVLGARTYWWKPGFEQDLRIDNVFGGGFLAVYDWGKGGISESGYDRDRARLNTFISCAQFYGIPGLFLFTLFLILAIRVFLNRSDALASLGFTVIVYSIVRGMASNHLLGFGSPIDRFSWLLMGISFHFTGILGASRQVHAQHGRWLRQWVSPGIARKEGNSIADNCGDRALRVTRKPLLHHCRRTIQKGNTISENVGVHPNTK